MSGAAAEALDSATAVDPAPQPRESQLLTLAREWRAGWRPGIAAIIGLSLGYTLWMHLSSFFIEPLQREFGWTRGEIALANSVGMITGFAAPFLGRVVDRVGAKAVALFGVITSALCFVALSQLNGSLSAYYAIYFILVIAGMATTGITYGRILVGTFKKSRGTSLALLRVGMGISLAGMPLLIYPAIAQFGSTGGFLMLAGVNVFVTLPILLFLVPGKRSLVEAGSQSAAQAGPSRWQLLARQPKILIVSLAAMLNSAPLAAIMTQLKPIGVSAGLTSATAVGAVSAAGIAPIAGALIAGIFVDRVWAPAVAFAMCAISAVGCAMLVLFGSDTTPAIFYLSVILVGIGMGGESDVLGYMVARYFGLNDYATIAGIAGLFVVVGIAIAASLIGRAYDIFGDYQVALVVAAITVLAAGFVFMLLGKYPDSVEE